MDDTTGDHVHDDSPAGQPAARDEDAHRDPTRDATGDAVAEPADLPADDGLGGGVPPYGTDFGREEQAPRSWVPQRSMPTPPTVPAAPSAPPTPRTIRLGGAAGRSLGGRIQPWQVVAIAVGVLVPVGFAVSAALSSDFEPPDRVPVSITRTRVAVQPSFTPPSIGVTPGPGVTVTVPQSPRPSRSVQTAPPSLVPVPAVPVTPVPTDASTIRFETYAEGGARVEVSLSDARHQRYDYPVQKAPLAFETRIDANVSSNDYYSLRVRIHDPTGSGDRGAVSCRILVDGIVVTSQQGRGYATCYISPYYDIRRT